MRSPLHYIMPGNILEICGLVVHARASLSTINQTVTNSIRMREGRSASALVFRRPRTTPGTVQSREIPGVFQSWPVKPLRRPSQSQSRRNGRNLLWSFGSYLPRCWRRRIRPRAASGLLVQNAPGKESSGSVSKHINQASDHSKTTRPIVADRRNTDGLLYCPGGQSLSGA